MGLFRRKSSDTVDAPATGPQASRRAAVKAGAPGRCPVCDGFGYIDQIDMISRTQTQHCRDCRHKWEFSFDEDGVVIDLTDQALADQALADQALADQDAVDRGSIPR